MKSLFSDCQGPASSGMTHSSSPDKGMASPCTRERNLLSHPGPSLSAPAGSRSDSRRQRQLRITAAACRRSAGNYPNAAAFEQPSSSICRKDGLRQATLGRRKLAVSLFKLTRHVFVDYLVGNLVELHVPGVRRLVVECQAAKAEKQSIQALPAACQGEDSEESEEVGLGGPFKDMMKLQKPSS